MGGRGICDCEVRQLDVSEREIRREKRERVDPGVD